MMSVISHHDGIPDDQAFMFVNSLEDKGVQK